MTVPAVTAEWNCTRCGSTNRKLVSAKTTRTTDRCTHCRHGLRRHDHDPRLRDRPPVTIDNIDPQDGAGVPRGGGVFVVEAQQKTTP